MDDIVLLQKIAKGDSKAFESLLLRHQKAVYGLSLRLLKSPSLAEDNAQDTWIRVVKSASSFEGKSKALTWILTITKNLALNYLQKKVWEEDLSPDTESQIAQDTEGVDLQIETAEKMEKLKKTIAQLPDRQRVVLVLWMEKEKSYSELAQEMKLNVNAVKVLLFRAKENVHKLMKEDS